MGGGPLGRRREGGSTMTIQAPERPRGALAVALAPLRRRVEKKLSEPETPTPPDSPQPMTVPVALIVVGLFTLRMIVKAVAWACLRYDRGWSRAWERRHAK